MQIVKQNYTFFREREVLLSIIILMKDACSDLPQTYWKLYSALYIQQFPENKLSEHISVTAFALYRPDERNMNRKKRFALD